jgi:type II secretion system protein G
MTAKPYLILALVFPFLLAATPASRPATMSATSTATPGASDPKASFLAFIKAIDAGDEKAAFEVLAFANDDTKKEAHALVGSSIAQRQWELAMDAEFKLTAPAAPPAQDAITQRVAASTTTVAGDSAQLKLSGQSTVYLVRDRGLWKIDFEKTQRTNEGPYDTIRVATEDARRLVFVDLTAQVKAKKFGTRAQALEELDKRLAAVPRPATKATVAGSAPLAGRNATIAALSYMQTAIDTFEVDTGRLLTEAEGLEALLANPGGDVRNTWTGPYVKNIPVDGWGRRFIYVRIDAFDYNIISSGPDGQIGTDDDIDLKSE